MIAKTWTSTEPFARSPGQAANPNLWRGLYRAFFPHLSKGGSRLLDFGPYRQHATIAYGSGDPEDGWVRDDELGPMFKSNGNANTFVNCGDGGDLIGSVDDTGEVSVVMWANAKGETLATNDRWFGTQGTSKFFLRTSDVDGTDCDLRLVATNDAGTEGKYDTTARQTLGGSDNHCIGLSLDWNDGSRNKFYIDGESVAVTDVGGNEPGGDSDTSTLDMYLLAANNSGSSASWQINHALGPFQWWRSRYLTSEDHRALYLDPFAVVRYRGYSGG